MLASENKLSLIFSPENSSWNYTNKHYIFSPIDGGEKATFSLVMSLLCCFAIVANATILYYSRKRQGWRQNRQRSQGVFKRSLAHYFVQSLAWTDFLCAVAIPAIFIGQLFHQIALKEWGCKLLRYMTIFFPTVTLTNLMVIGAERYVAVFHPFFAITKGTAKKAIFLAWICGGLVTLIPASTYKVIKQEIGSDSYTLICKYDLTVPLYKILIIGFTSIVYIIPSLVLVGTSIRIIKYLSQRKLFLMRKHKASSWRLKKTAMFLKLIFSFVIPYFLYVIYIIIYMAANGEIAYKDDFIIRRCSAILSFSNTVVNPIILYSSISGLRKMLKDFRNRFRCFIRGHLRGNVVYDVRTETTPCRVLVGGQDSHCPNTAPPKAWTNRERRNGLGVVRSNVILPTRSYNVTACYNTGVQLTTFSNNSRKR